ncbi:MAG TPA: YciI family protein [Gemmatimonadaceae bacterium]|jgi:Uncharacterized protein conserved in bacteria
MRYVCLIYEDEKNWAELSEEQSDAIMSEYSAFTNSIQRSGHYLQGEALQPTKSATTVRVRDGKISTTEGPVAETREQLGGYYLIKARDMDEATRIAARIPSARFGSVEVRPVVELNEE